MRMISFLKFKKIENSPQGFTLLEMLLAIFIFSVMAVAIAGIYVSFSHLQQRSRAQEQIVNDTNYVLEVMAKEFRTGKIFDYTPQDTCNTLIQSTNPDECIILVRDDGQLVVFTIYGASRDFYMLLPSCDIDYTNCVWNDDFKKQTVLISGNLNNLKIPVGGFKFIISPGGDPLVEGSTYNSQPMVTLMLKTESDSDSSIKQVSNTLQTTISARLYQR